MAERRGRKSEQGSTATMDAPRARRRPLGAVVRVLDPAAKPSTYRLSSGKCVVGAATTCDVVVPAATVSRQHLELSLVPEGVLVKDLGSRNGTFYVGQRVERIVLAFGGRIRAGATELAIDADVEALAGELHPKREYRGMVGASAAMRRLFTTLARLEGSLVTVLVTGESGVGKELVAQALHEGSPVSDGPLVVLNCGAFSRDLVASELFGHRRGAFTGATDNRRGAFESANGGTLFLDEVGELPLDVQPILLRVLEAGEVRPLGSDQARKVAVRVVAATNRDLLGEVAAGTFREDLFYRLAVVRLDVPPLRERPEDIEPLAARFAGAAGERKLPPDVVAELLARPWPGNVRELKNAIAAYLALGHLPPPQGARARSLDDALASFVDVARAYGDQKDELADRFTRAYLIALMQHTQGNQTQAARLAKLDRTYLGRLLVKYELSKT